MINSSQYFFLRKLDNAKEKKARNQEIFSAINKDFSPTDTLSENAKFEGIDDTLFEFNQDNLNEINKSINLEFPMTYENTPDVTTESIAEALEDAVRTKIIKPNNKTFAALKSALKCQTDADDKTINFLIKNANQNGFADVGSNALFILFKTLEITMTNSNTTRRFRPFKNNRLIMQELTFIDKAITSANPSQDILKVDNMKTGIVMDTRYFIEYKPASDSFEVSISTCHCYINSSNCASFMKTAKELDVPGSIVHTIKSGISTLISSLKSG